MKPIAKILSWTLLSALTLLSAPAEAAGPKPRTGDRWAASVITVESTHRQYDLFQPWSRRVRTTAKGGIVIGPKEVLTTADDLNDRTLLRFQRDGRGQWSKAELIWIDYQANLAVLTTNDEGFWIRCLNGCCDVTW